MSCVSSRIKVTWISEFRIDPANRQLHFVHRQSTLNATRGMKVIWDFEERHRRFCSRRIHHRHDPEMDLDRPWPDELGRGSIFYS